MEIIIFMGIQASGKSTFYKRYFFDTHIRLNLDMLNTRNRERILLDACLESKTKIVIDNTNPTYKDREYYITKAKLHKYAIIGFYFSADVAQSKERNKKRNHPIPEIAIISTHKKLQLPTYNEGFKELFYVKCGPDTFSIEEWRNEL
jgi:predicted kinase